MQIISHNNVYGIFILLPESVMHTLNKVVLTLSLWIKILRL